MASKDSKLGNGQKYKSPMEISSEVPERDKAIDALALACALSRAAMRTKFFHLLAGTDFEASGQPKFLPVEEALTNLHEAMQKKSETFAGEAGKIATLRKDAEALLLKTNYHHLVKLLDELEKKLQAADIDIQDLKQMLINIFETFNESGTERDTFDNGWIVIPGFMQRFFDVFIRAIEAIMSKIRQKMASGAEMKYAHCYSSKEILAKIKALAGNTETNVAAAENLRLKFLTVAVEEQLYLAKQYVHLGRNPWLKVEEAQKILEGIPEAEEAEKQLVKQKFASAITEIAERILNIKVYENIKTAYIFLLRINASGIDVMDPLKKMVLAYTLGQMEQNKKTEAITRRDIRKMEK